LVLSVESWSSWLVASGLPDSEPRGPIYSDSNLVIEAVRQGQGVTLTRRSLVHDLLRSNELVQLSEIVVPYTSPYWLVWPARSEGTKKLTAFANWLTDQVRTYRAGLG
jgi:LysR family glycine cleavage system transcriptional activator